MTAQPPLSIVIPSHSRTDLLEMCLQSLAWHAPSGTQIIVVDDGSVDAAVSRTAQRMAVECIRLDSRRGFCGAANAGIAAARAEIVELLNDDTQVTHGWAEKPLTVFDDPRIGAVAPLVLLFPGHVIDSAGNDYHSGGFARPRGRGMRPSGRWLDACNVDGASACAAFYRKQAVVGAGGFPTSFEAYFDDVDLSLRLRRDGFVIHYVPQSRVLHRGSSSYGRPQARLISQQSRNEEWLFWRNAARRPGELLCHAAVLAAKAVKRLNDATFIPWLGGRIDAWTTVGKSYLIVPHSRNPDDQE